jgi:hypothetical protein
VEGRGGASSGTLSEGPGLNPSDPLHSTDISETFKSQKRFRGYLTMDQV